MKTKTKVLKRTQPMDVLLAVVVLGSLWGLAEVVLNGAIRVTGLPFRAGILTGVGVGLLAIAAGAFRRSVILVFIPLIAILCKQLVVPILGVSVLCKANSCLAVVLEGLAVTGVVYLAGRKLDRNRLAQIGSGASATLLAAGVFYFIGTQLAPCKYLLSFNRPDGFAAFLVAEGLVWAAFSALLFPVGYWIGVRFRDTVLVLERKPLLYYATSAALVVGSWTASTLAISAGF